MGYEDYLLMKKSRQMNCFVKLFTFLHKTGCSLAIYQMIAVSTLAIEALLVWNHLAFFALSRASSDQLMTVSFFERMSHNYS